MLADFGQFRAQLLDPIKLRGVKCQIARSTLAARSHAVGQRTFMINFIRAQVRNPGESNSMCSAATFHKTAPLHFPAKLHSALGPLIKQFQCVTKVFAEYDREIDRLCKKTFRRRRL
jgi:transposase